MKKSILLLTVLTLLCLNFNALAQEQEDPPTASPRLPNPFLQPNINFNLAGGGARALGLGQAFIGIADDATALSWNPAGLTQLVKPEFSIVGNRTNSSLTNSSIRSLRDDQQIDTELQGIEFASFTFPFKVKDRAWVVSAAYQNQIQFDSNEQSFFGQYGIDSLNTYDSAYNLDTNTDDIALYNDFFNDEFIENTFSGGINSFSMGLATNVTDIFSVGITANYWTSTIEYSQVLSQSYVGWLYGYRQLDANGDPIGNLLGVGESSWYFDTIEEWDNKYDYSAKSDRATSYSFNLGGMIDLSRSESNPIPLRIGFTYKSAVALSYTFNGNFIANYNNSNFGLFAYDSFLENNDGGFGEFIPQYYYRDIASETYQYESAINFELPSTFGIGLSYQWGNLTLSADYEVRNFAQSITSEQFVPLAASTLSGISGFEFVDIYTNPILDQDDLDRLRNDARSVSLNSYDDSFYQPRATFVQEEITRGRDLQQIRIGAEYLLPIGFGVIPLRVGFQTFPTTINNQLVIPTYDEESQQRIYGFAGGEEISFDTFNPMTIENFDFDPVSSLVRGQAYSVGTGFITGRFALDIAYQMIEYQQEFRYLGFKSQFLPEGGAPQEQISFTQINNNTVIDKRVFDSSRLTASLIVYF